MLQAVDVFARYSLDALSWVEDVLGVRPDRWQREALQAISERDKVSIKSGHGVGKSAFDAWVLLWFASTRYPWKIPCTAPTAHQLQDILWAELSWWHRRMPSWLRDAYAIQSDAFVLKSDPRTCFAAARTARVDTPDALQGFHSPNLLFIIDEASGVPEQVFEVAQGALSTEGAKVVMTGNPTRSTGTFYRTHTVLRDRYYCMTVSSLEAEHASKEYCEDVARVYGVESSVYRVRVLGEFPKSEDDVLIPVHLIESAMTRDVEPIDRYRPVWGLDVARFGDDRSTLAKRRGNAMLEPVLERRGHDLMQTVGWVVGEYKRTAPDERPAEICVDVIGLGAGVADRLRELGLPVVEVNAAESARDDRFLRLRDELWWAARQWFERRDCTVCKDDATWAEMVDTHYTYVSSGKIQVEPKDKMKVRLGHSPDRADALVLTFAGGQTIRDEDKAVQDRYARALAKTRAQARRSRSWKT